MNSGADLLLSIYGDSGSSPNSTLYASAYVPAEWITNVTSTPTTFTPSCGVPMPCSLTSGTSYWLVIKIANSNASNANKVYVGKASAATTSGAYTSVNGATWVAQSYGYAVQFYGGQTSATSGMLSSVVDDSNAKMTAYTYNGSFQMDSVRTWVAKLASAPSNLLSRDDAGFTASVSNWTGTNCTISLQSGTNVLDGTTSMKLTAGTTPVSMSVVSQIKASTTSGAVTYVPVTPSTIYSATAAVLPGTTTRNIQVSINWYQSSGAASAITPTSIGTAVSEVAGVFTIVTATGTAPSDASVAAVKIAVAPSSGTLATGEIHYVDCVGLFAGSNTTWSYPGLGVSSVKTLTYTSNGYLSSAS
jgi:hypothetical protein